MVKQEFDINSLRIASPCPVGWERMTGDNRKRFCGLCSLNVYNISEMNAPEVEALVWTSEGRVCARMYRRADGTVITRDCPVGLSAYRKKVSRFAGATLAMILGLFSAGYGQSQESKEKKVVIAAELNILKKAGLKSETRLSGTLCDRNGAVVPGIDIKLLAGDGKRTWSAKTDDQGVFSFADLPPGAYALDISPNNGFQGVLVKDINIEAGTFNELNISLEVAAMTEIVGFMVDTTEIIRELSREIPPGNIEHIRKIAPAVPPKKP